ncbi:MAG: SprT-like domain-containing protein [Chromatocurvus sp.]
MSDSVTPRALDASGREVVRAATRRVTAAAAAAIGVDLAPVPVEFDLAGRSAGQFVGRGAYCLIRFNPWIFARYFEENLATTVPHEVAHYAVYRAWPGRRVKPHGSEWRSIMRALNVEPSVTFDLDLSGLPRRQQRRHRYHCGCKEHDLSTTRHNRVSAGRARYACLQCRRELQYIG